MSKAMVSINTFNNGSTGKIMRGISEEARAEGWKAYCAYGRYNPELVDRDNDIIIGTKRDVYLHYLYAKATTRRALGPASRGATKKLVSRMEEIGPDLVHLHNLHGYYLNIEVLFDYLRRSEVPVRWTLHDCWAFTGHCGHFTYVKCPQWMTHCGYSGKCPQIGVKGSKWLVDSSAYNFDRKRELFCSLGEDQLELITPSQWLADLVAQSYLSKYPVRAVHNKVDTSVFKPTPSDFRERFGIGNRFMILGVASPWSERKGLSDFVRLAQELDDRRYAIVLVGLSKRQMRDLPKAVVGLERTESQQQLAEIYTAADVHVQPSIEETFGMTVAESCACGTPVIVREGSACVEAAKPGMAYATPVGFDALKASIVKLAGGGLIILVERTDSQAELAAIYTTADVLFNPTREDNYPTVNLEAEACGTPVVTYDVGGCRETVRSDASRVVVGYDDAFQIIVGNWEIA